MTMGYAPNSKHFFSSKVILLLIEGVKYVLQYEWFQLVYDPDKQTMAFHPNQ